jgi:hypothetical protein
MEQVHQNSSVSTSAKQALRIDREQATAQLEALGQCLSHSVYIRAFLPKQDPRSALDKGRKADQLNWEQLERWQAQGYSIHLVVNGGGHKDENVKCCRAIFIEHDDLDIELQRCLWRTLELPEPTIQIQTRKSVHSYWAIEGGCDVKDWKPLQADLLAYTKADPALKNPSRVMRLAGSYHMKPGSEPLRCNIIQNSGKRHSYQELRTAIPLQQPQPSPQSQLPLLARSHKPEPHHPSPQYQRYEEILVPVPESVPLEVCLCRESRALLESGIGEGGRNTNGAKLARDLIGTANYLQTIRQQFLGDPRQLLEDYANRCTPPLPVKEVEAIWKSALKDSPTPSCQGEGVEACIRAWYWKHHVKPQQLHQTSWKSNNHHASQGFGSGKGGSSGSQPPIAAVTLRASISEILHCCETESEIASALIDLAAATGRTYNEINSLAKIIRSEGDLATEVIEAVKSFQGTLKSCRKRLDIRRYLEPALAEPLLAQATAMPTAPEYLFNTLLATSGSRIGTTARIVINPEGGYTQPCIFWTANVAHSGQAKTPPQQVVLKPLEEMEASSKQLHDIQLEDYEQDKDSDSKPPVRQRRLLNNVTTSTKIRIHQENPRGLLEYLDELVADYQRLNQYKSGKGDDLQLELSFWNGSGSNYDRHDVRLFLKRTAFSKTGTYQWDTLARLMADDVNFIASGYSARFLYCSILDAPARYLDLLSFRRADTLKEKLQWLYGELEKLPEADYLLSHEAKVLFQGWNHTLVNAEIEEVHFGLSLVYAKIESYTARIALWLHLVNALLRGEKPEPVIAGETMQHAIEIASFYLWQHKLIHAHNAPNRQLEGIFLKVQTSAEKFFAKCGKGISASFLKTRINALKSWVVEKIRSSVFKTLAASGHGRIEGEGSEMVYIPNSGAEASSEQLVGVGERLVEPPIAKNSISTDLQAPVGEIGAQAKTSMISQNSEEAITSLSFANALPPDHRTVASTGGLGVPFGDGGEAPARHCPHCEMFMGETPKTTLAHQFTNWDAETTAISDLQTVGESTNSPPTAPTAPTAPIESQRSPSAQELAALVLRCSTWVELAQAVSNNAKQLMKAASQMTQQQRTWIAELLKTHLCSHPSALSQLAWIPEKLRHVVFGQLSFTIRQISKATGSLELCWQHIAACRLIEIKTLETGMQQWTFQTPDGNSISVGELAAIASIAAI